MWASYYFLINYIPVVLLQAFNIPELYASCHVIILMFSCKSPVLWSPNKHYVLGIKLACDAVQFQ